MIFLRLIFINVQRHRIRSLISIAGIAFSVAAMLAIVTILQGAIGMFSGILSSDSEIIEQVMFGPSTTEKLSVEDWLRTVC